jgi:hypothetical protein
MASSSPASRVSARSGSVVKSSASARAWISRAGPPRSASGRRHIRGSPSAAITSAIPVRFSGVPSAVSAWAISSIECPAARSSLIRGRAASLAGAVLGPGRPETKNSRVPARKSRTADSSEAGV